MTAFSIRFSLSMALACAMLVAHAAPIDQQQTTSKLQPVAQIDGNQLAQSFVPAQSNSVGAGIFRYDFGVGTASVTIELWKNNLPGQSGAVMLATGSGDVKPDSALDVYWLEVPIKAGDTYYLVFTSPDSDVALAGDSGDPYPPGQAYEYLNAGFSPVAGFDYYFKTYYNDLTAPAPEPATLALFALGFAGAMFSRRRRKA